MANALGRNRNSHQRRALKIRLLIKIGVSLDCPACNRRLASGKSREQIANSKATLTRIQIDHIVPLERGGDWDIDNLQLMHARCNRLKSDMTMAEFRVWCNDKIKVMGKRKFNAWIKGNE